MQCRGPFICQIGEKRCECQHPFVGAVRVKLLLAFEDVQADATELVYERVTTLSDNVDGCLIQERGVPMLG